MSALYEISNTCSMMELGCVVSYPNLPISQKEIKARIAELKTCDECDDDEPRQQQVRSIICNTISRKVAANLRACGFKEVGRYICNTDDDSTLYVMLYIDPGFEVTDE